MSRKNDLYKMYEEELNAKEKALSELKNIKLNLSFLQEEYQTYKIKTEKKLNEAYKEINRLKNELNQKYNNNEKDYLIDKLNNQINKDSTNSSIPTSKEIKPKRTNTYNHRKVSFNSTGGQIKHRGTTLTKTKLEEKIKENNLKVKIINHYVDNTKYSKNIEKYSVGIKVTTYIEKHIFIPSNKSKELLPKEYYSDVTYNSDLKSLVVLLGNYFSLPYNKITELISDLTNNIINLSEGTIDNIYNDFSIKVEDTISNITNNLLKGTYQHTDETVTKENGKDSYYRGYANKENVLYKYHHKKGDISIKEDKILPNFFGTLITDHDVGMFKYGTNNQDCIVHFGRYCIEQKQNITITSWQMRLYNLLLKFERNRRILIKFQSNKFNEDEIELMEKEYDNIIILAKEENKLIPSTYWREKANTLLNRCIKYKKEMLFYIYDFSIDYDNNFMERALRMIKTKTKISGGFRSYNGAVRFGNIMSVIKTSILRKLNPYNSVVSIMDGISLFG